MQTLTAEEINNLYTLGLNTIIGNWQNYSQETVLLSYAELKRRNQLLSVDLVNQAKEFSVRNGYTDIDKFLDTYLKQDGNFSFHEYKDFKKAETQTDIYSTNYITDKKYPTLKAVIGYLNFVAWVTVIISIVIIIVALLTLDGNFVSKAIVVASTFVIGSAMCVFLLASAEGIKVLVDIELNTRKAAEKR